jgi:hypothetical protein
MANKIIGSMGQLGTGKTLDEIIWLYEGYCEGLPTYSNLRVNFPHIPLKTLEDIALKMNCQKFYKKYDRNGRSVLDELWKLADNRKCFDAITELIDIVLLDSRKKHIDIYYSQQFLQIDPRLAYITNEWRFPLIIPFNPKEEISKYNPPKTLIIERYNNIFNRLQPKVINCTPYLTLYNSDENAYLIQKMISADAIKELLEKIANK